MADFNEYKGVWVFCEQRQGALMPTDFELVSEARKLADELGCEVTGLLLGDNVEGIAKELGGYGADKVMVCDSPLLKDYTTDAYAKVVCDMVNEYKPEVLLIGATNIGRDLGPRCAARLHTGLTADATHLDIDTAKYIDFLKESSTIDLSKQKFDMEDRNLKMTRPAFGGSHEQIKRIKARQRRLHGFKYPIPKIKNPLPKLITACKPPSLPEFRREKPDEDVRNARNDHLFLFSGHRSCPFCLSFDRSRTLL